MGSAATSARRRILFDHIPKTGGVSLHEVLVTKLGSRACSPILNAPYATARAEFDTYECVSGHIQYAPGSALSDVWALTLVREPLDRLLSEYFYHRYIVAPDGNPLGELARALELVEYVSSDDPWLVPSISNVMVNHFYLLKWDGRSDASDEQRLSGAKAALEEFRLVGITERFDETVDLMCAALDLGPVDRVPKANVNARRPASADVPSEVRKVLARRNELDREFYAHARTVHDRARRRVIFASELGKLADVARSPVVEAPAAGRPSFGTKKAEILAVEVHGSTILGATLLAGETGLVRVIFRAHEALDHLVVGIHIFDRMDRLVFGTNTRLLGKVLSIQAGMTGHVDFGFAVSLGVGDYFVGAALHPNTPSVLEYYDWVQKYVRFEVSGNIGWHFEGSVKLNPAVAVGGAEVREATVRSQVALPQRLGRHAPALTDFSASLATTAELPQMTPGEVIAICVDLTNTGNERWWSTGERNVSIAYHWLDDADGIVVFDGERSALPQDMGPGDAMSVWAKIRAPDGVGRFRLRITLVQEFVGWFDELGGSALDLPALVVERG